METYVSISYFEYSSLDWTGKSVFVHIIYYSWLIYIKHYTVLAKLDWLSIELLTIMYKLYAHFFVFIFYECQLMIGSSAIWNIVT